MTYWSENSNGNFVYVIDRDEVMCVYPNKLFGGWTGRLNDTFLKGSYDTPEEAQEAMEKLVFDEQSSLGKTATSSWKPAKKGGFYRQNANGIVTAKLGKFNKWFVTLNGEMVEGCWLDSLEEAKALANSLIT